MNRFDRIVASFLLASASWAAEAQPRVVIDGEFSDWLDADASIVDPVGDATGLFDLTRLDVTTAGTVVYVRLSFTEPYNIQAADAIGSGVGLIFELPDGGMLDLALGDRDPTLVRSGEAGTESERLVWTQIDYASLPTPASTDYEIRVDLGAAPVGVDPGSSVSVRLTGSDTSESVTVVLDVPAETTAFRTPGRFACTEFRVASLNTLRGGLTGDPEVAQRLRRLVAAARADVYAFQEQVNIPVAGRNVGDVLEQLDPFGDGAAWYTHGSDDVVASRYPLVPLPKIPEANAAVVLLPGRPVVVYSFHPACCGIAGDGQDQSRIMASQGVVQQVADLRAGELGPDLEPYADAAVVVIGDYNLVGSFEPLDVLAQAGFSDWPLLDLGGRDAITWRFNDGRPGSFWPGRLDLVVHTDDLGRRNGFVIDTARLDSDTIESSTPALMPADSTGSDHLMLVADFGTPLPADQNGDGRLGPEDLDAWLARYEAGDLRADVNIDGKLDRSDYNAWLRLFTGGCE
ncbi:MAG: endonuclease/exonuclease/phosphatase family protein [Planctomycetota bacterium]